MSAHGVTPIPKLTEWMIAKGKATQWIDRDQPEIVAEKFQLPPALKARSREDPLEEISRFAEAIGASFCLRQLQAPLQRPNRCPWGLRLMKAGCNARLVKITADQTCAIARLRNAHRCDTRIFEMGIAA
jgi:hypothetical protein